MEGQASLGHPAHLSNPTGKDPKESLVGKVDLQTEIAQPSEQRRIGNKRRRYSEVNDSSNDDSEPVVNQRLKLEEGEGVVKKKPSRRLNPLRTRRHHLYGVRLKAVELYYDENLRLVDVARKLRLPVPTLQHILTATKSMVLCQRICSLTARSDPASWMG